MTSHTLAPQLPLPRAPAVPRSNAAAAADTRDADDTIRRSVLARLRQQPWWDADSANVYVEQGTVVLQGLVRDASARLAGRLVAEAVPGVQRVWDARVLPRE